MSGRYKAGTGGANTGKQRTYVSPYSAQDCDENTQKVLGDVPYSYATHSLDKVRLGADHPDLGTYPGDKPNFYVSGDGFKLGKQLTGPDIDPDGSRAMQKGWHRKAGFPGVVSDDENEQGGTHPKRGTTNMKSRGTDTRSSDQGGPKGGFSWS